MTAQLLIYERAVPIFEGIQFDNLQASRECERHIFQQTHIC
jgi:hypothetical protein